MRSKIISFLKSHPVCLKICWSMAHIGLWVWGLFVPIRKKTMIFCSFGGRKFDDSPKAIYDEVCSRNEFDDWTLIWAFVNPEKFDIPRGKKIKVDTLKFFHALLYSRVWVSNSGMDRGIELHRRQNIIVETWHGTPLKKIGGDENENSLGGGIVAPKGKPDKSTIRCAQSDFDRDIFARIFNADKSAILLSDLPRNDALFKYSQDDISKIKRDLGISENKKVILYTPTYREYLVNENNDTFLAPPIDFKMCKEMLGEGFFFLVRAHYAVAAALHIVEDDFVKDVSNYPCLNDLYIISDIMVSDYSSTYFDYSILKRPMLCFAYDLEEYSLKRGLYLNLEDTLPCRIDTRQEELIDSIKNLDYKNSAIESMKFHEKFSPYAGNASKVVVDEIVARLEK